MRRMSGSYGRLRDNGARDRRLSRAGMVTVGIIVRAMSKVARRDWR